MSRLVQGVRERLKRAWPVLPALVLYALGAMAMRGFVTDDALITLRYARRWADGHGISWNGGPDPVEGFTNFSHVALGALALRLQLPALTCVRGINVLATFALVLLTYDMVLRALGSRAWAGIAAALIAIHPALWYWSVSGLETSAYACALLLGLWALQRGRNGLACAALLVASLTRFEGCVAAATALGVQALFDAAQRRRQALLHLLPWVALYGALYGAYFAWRFEYFGYLMPNSAYYKNTGGADGVLVRAFLEQNAPLLALMPLAPLLRLGSLGWQLWGLLLVYVAGFYGVHPSVSGLHRFFLPVYAPAVVLAVAGLQRVWLAPRFRILARCTSAALLVIAVAWDVGTPRNLERLKRRADDNGARMLTRVQVAAFIAGRYPRNTRVLMQDVGLVGYALLNPIDDAFGLNDEALTHRFELHRLPYLHALLARNPGVVVLASTDQKRLTPYYATDRTIATHPFFRNYRLVETVISPVENYHYMLFARAGLMPRSNAEELAVGTTPDRGWLIDSFARRVWQAQRTHRRESDGGAR